MREKVAPFYWTAAGALAGFGLIGLMTIGTPFLPAGVVLALVGLPLLWTRGTWAFFVGFGGLPALVFLLHIFNGVRTALNPYCAEMGEPGALAAGAAGPGLVLVCSGQLLCMFAVFAAVALLGAAAGRLLRRTGHRAAST